MLGRIGDTLKYTLLICTLCIFFTACGSGHTAGVLADGHKYFVEKQKYSSDADNEQCICEQIGENEYKITLYDEAYNEVFSQVYSDMRIPPWVERITDTIWEVGVSVGSPARYTFYFDAETAEISDTYFNAILFGDKYIAYMEDDVIGADTITLTLTDIFKEDILHQEIERDFSVLADPMSAVKSVELVDDVTVRLEYYAGEEMTLVSEAIELKDPLLLLKDGNIKQITGFGFGDAFNYDIYEIAGYTYSINDGSRTQLYRLKNGKMDNFNFCFNGKGKRFSGVIAYDGYFCGIKIDEDTMDKVVPVLGEPDEYQDGDSSGQIAVYRFTEAALMLDLGGNDVINRIEYAANDGIADADLDEPTEFETALQDDFDYVETIYYWEVGQDKVFTSHNHDDYDADKIPQFIEDYLKEQGTYKEEPDGITYFIQDEDLNGSYVEYYEVERKYSFVFHVWGEYWIDPEAGTSEWLEDIYCATVTLDEESREGNLIHTYDAGRGITNEELYDAWGTKMSDVSYEYLSDIPFPFITEYWNLDTHYDLVHSALCREQKAWFYKEQAEFDADGRFIRYNGNINPRDYKEYFPYPCTCIYDASGRLEAIREELQDYDIEMGWGWWDDAVDYSGQMEFNYEKSGQLSTVEYLRSSYMHGSYDSSGTIYYDGEGRMIDNSHYVTHGGDSHIYLYKEDSDKPWACLNWCSFVPGFETIYIYEQD